jgi:hypothetical protein
VIHFARLRMADHRVHFTLGSHIRFGSLDFLCMGVDHNMVLLPPSVTVNPVSPLGSNECVREPNLAGKEGECILPTPTGSFGSPTDVESIIELMASLCLHANET